MAGFSVKSNSCRICIKTFGFKFTNVTAVNCVCKFRFYKVKGNLIHTVTGFFIRRKNNFNFSMFYFRMRYKIFKTGHNFCNAGLIICTKQCSPVCSNDCFLIFCCKSKSFVFQWIMTNTAFQINYCTIIFRINNRIYTFSGYFFNCINMC